jgi:hypothetical protein
VDFYFDDNFGLIRFWLPDGNRLGLTFRGFALRGIYDSNVSHKTQFSKQLDDF